MVDVNKPRDKRDPVVGENVVRVDGAAKVSGIARYVDDMAPMPGELHGATVRSRVARGILRGIVFDPSFDWSDVTIVTAKDVPDNVVQLIVDDQPVLASERINHMYEPVALLACADKQKLARALEAVSLDIEPLPAVFDMEESFAAKTVVWGDANVQNRYLITKGAADTEDSDAAIDAAIAACDVVVRGSYGTHHQEQLYIEPNGMIAWWDDAGAHATGSLQCPYYVHKAFKRCFHLEPEQIHITQAVTGGGFGGKEEYPSLIAMHAALLAKKSGKPVRIIYDRVEDFEATTKRHPSHCIVESGCD